MSDPIVDKIVAKLYGEPENVECLAKCKLYDGMDDQPCGDGRQHCQVALIKNATTPENVEEPT